MAYEERTRLLFVTTQLAALAWVTVSYLIALYATVRLEQPFPVVELEDNVLNLSETFCRVFTTMDRMGRLDD